MKNKVLKKMILIEIFDELACWIQWFKNILFHLEICLQENQTTRYL